MIRAPSLALALLLAAAPASAQEPAAPAAAQQAGALAWLTGIWRGPGTMFQQRSEATLAVRPALGGRFVELSYRAGSFEGRAFYRPLGEGRWQATWFDNRGVTFPIEATLAGQTLTANWGTAETERGRTVYRLAADGSLHVTDSVVGRDGAWRDFATHVLTRAE